MKHTSSYLILMDLSYTNTSTIQMKAPKVQNLATVSADSSAQLDSPVAWVKLHNEHQQYSLQGWGKHLSACA